MTLESATKHIVESICRWTDKFKDNPHYVIVNFPGVFIYYTKGILTRTNEFRTYGNMGFLKQRNLSYDIEEGKIKYIRLYNLEDNDRVKLFTKYLDIDIKDYYKNNIIERSIEINKELLNLQELNQFKF